LNALLFFILKNLPSDFSFILNLGLLRLRKIENETK